MHKAALEPASFRSRISLALISSAGLLTAPMGGRGYYQIAEGLGRLVPDDCVCTLRLSPDASFAFPLNDPYWARLLGSRFRYEPELDSLLTAIRPIDYVFVDAGANFGYWSVLASSAAFAARPTVAIEALSLNFRYLAMNQIANQRRFVALHAAVSASDGARVAIEYPIAGPASRVGAGIVGESGAAGTGNSVEADVVTVTLDAAVRNNLPGDRPVVVKLDVEGAELDALRGARHLVQGDALFAYEDHGKDRQSEVTGAFLDLGFRVLFIDDSGDLTRISSPTQATAVKTVTHRGYNFIALHPGGAFDGALRAYFTDAQPRP